MMPLHHRMAQEQFSDLCFHISVSYSSGLKLRMNAENAGSIRMLSASYRVIWAFVVSNVLCS